MSAISEAEKQTTNLCYTKTSKRNILAYKNTYGLKILIQTARPHGDNCQEYKHSAKEYREHLTQRKVTSQSSCHINTRLRKCQYKKGRRKKHVSQFQIFQNLCECSP
uniref:Uncharacterized protein n=1 Tax=Ixodes ricinus TaxID=34613 RepID=A0A147BDG4_IXORI